MSPSTVLCIPEPGAWGPTNNLAALGEALAARGHEIVFAVDETFAGILEQRGFGERHYRTSAETGDEEVVGDIWVSWIRDNKANFRRPTIEQIETVIKPIWEELIATAEFSHERLTEIIAELRPDLIVVDCVAAFPAVAASGIPWVRCVSANPLELRDPDLPPTFAGYSVGDRGLWADYEAEYRRLLTDTHGAFSELCSERGAPALPELEFQHLSPQLNLYEFPAAADYQRAQPLGPSWHRLETSVRTGEQPFDLDAHLPGEGPVIYLSLGSLGSLDTELLQRLIDVLGTTGHRLIVSMGTLGEELQLGERAYGEEFLPQPSVLEHCDLMLCHGGNNTFNEAFYFGLPAIVLPLFWDQYDNAQRAADTGLGRRLDTYGFEDAELTEAVETLLGDDALHTRLAEISTAIRSRPGRDVGAELIAALI